MHKKFVCLTIFFLNYSILGNFLIIVSVFFLLHSLYIHLKLLTLNLVHSSLINHWWLALIIWIAFLMNIIIIAVLWKTYHLLVLSYIWKSILERRCIIALRINSSSAIISLKCQITLWLISKIRIKKSSWLSIWIFLEWRLCSTVTLSWSAQWNPLAWYTVISFRFKTT